MGYLQILRRLYLALADTIKNETSEEEGKSIEGISNWYYSPSLDQIQACETHIYPDLDTTDWQLLATTVDGVIIDYADFFTD